MQTTVNRRSSNFRGVELMKNIPFIEYQRMLVYADLDDFTPASVISTLFGGISGGLCDRMDGGGEGFFGDKWFGGVDHHFRRAGPF